ncbi:Carboxylesterase 12 [Actinidia chinensis var. chinensis]|uniref:Carboxylesterase 12 n=1 Tax=Actinidia chinensis var. chinensis TaxID=1590841 RepID=A0A2R6QYW5_ACTCC|nr:Carboxylesterase 12 [Actinidia chinensis var. chinensis]
MTCYTTSACFFLFLLFVIASGDCDAAKGGPYLPLQIPKPEVNYKDVTIVDGVCARLYVPISATPNQKLPLVVYFHGGAFTMFSAFLPPYDDYLYSLSTKANVVALSVEYRRPLTYPIPIPFDDSWAAVKWVASHSAGRGPEELVNNHVDFTRVFLQGDSAGGTIAHNIALRAGLEKPEGLNIAGLALMHPYFWGSKPISTRETRNETESALAASVWFVAGGSNIDDPRVNPLEDPNLSSLGCNKVLVVIAEQDIFRDRGFYYYDALGKSGWKGKAEVMETPGEHVFYIHQPNTTYAEDIFGRVSSFVSCA